MSEWNAMTYEGKDTILRVVRDEAEAHVRAGRPARGLGAADRRATAGRRATSSATSSTRPRATSRPSTRRAAPARRRPHGLTVMAELANAGRDARSAACRRSR